MVHITNASIFAFPSVVFIHASYTLGIHPLMNSNGAVGGDTTSSIRFPPTAALGIAVLDNALENLPSQESSGVREVARLPTVAAQCRRIKRRNTQPIFSPFGAGTNKLFAGSSVLFIARPCGKREKSRKPLALLRSENAVSFRL